MLNGRILSSQRRRWAWLLVCLCIGQGLLPDIVLCVEADGRLMVEPAVEGKCSDLVRAIPAGKYLSTFVATSRYCELCEDLPLASGSTFRLPAPVQTRELLLAVPVAMLHPALQFLMVELHRTTASPPPLLIPSSALTALRSTILLI